METYNNYLKKKEQLKQLEIELKEEEKHLSSMIADDIIHILKERNQTKFAINIEDVMLKDDLRDDDYEYYCNHLECDDDLWFEYETRISNGAIIMGVLLDSESNLLIRTELDYSDYHDSHTCGKMNLEKEKCINSIPPEIMNSVYSALQREDLIHFNNDCLVDDWDKLD
jgi:hypothetical protein